MAKKELSRREFLKGMAAGAVGVAAVGVLPGCGDYVLQDSKAAAAAEEAKVAAIAAAKEAAAAGGTPIYTPGTYTASAKGINGDVTVTMTFDEFSITDAKIDVSGETPDIGGAIGGQMEQAILVGQTADVDAVTGASITSDAIRTAAADCIAQASGKEVVLTERDEGGSADWLGTAPEIAESDITEELSTEVLVVGCGTGGWIAAMTAAEEGSKVLVVEKAETPTKIKEDIGSINSKLQLEAFKTFPEFEINKTEALQEIVRYASGYVDSDLVKVWIDNSGELVDWLTDILEGTGHWYMSLEGGIGNQEHPERDKAFATGHSPHPVEGKPDEVTLNTDMQEFVETRGGEIRCNTSLVKLEQDASGKVTGIIAQDTNDEHYIRIKASKGVIMATGGYASNTAMMLALQPQTMKMKINVPMGSKSDGAGIKAMLWAGGEMDPCHASMMFNRCSCLPTETAGYKTNGKWFWFGEQPFLKVNLNGKRFCNESGPYEFMLHSMYMQPNHTYCDIFDANNKQYCEQFDEVGCCRLFPFDNGALSNRGYDATWKEMTEGENSHLALGYLQKADTLEELAEKLNIPVDNFVESVKRYNELCYKGVDEDYGKGPHRMTPVDTAPFYGIRTGAWHLTTLDGCRINTDMQVIREDGTPIEGLYATGDCTGGFFANNYPNLFTGLACGRTMTFGRRAAKNVSKR
ncbi:MAG: FAD-binding protein [Oscillospiraceae bacterium]|nr:FAD-binding protein [Oscillospiraceae bacterium]